VAPDGKLGQQSPGVADWSPDSLLGIMSSGIRCARTFCEHLTALYAVECSQNTYEVLRKAAWMGTIAPDPGPKVASTRPQNALSALPKSAHPGAKKALAEIRNAEDKDHARAAVAFDELYGVKSPKATAKIADDVEELLAFSDYPAEHWIHLRTTNPIESTFATVRHRTKVTKGPGSKAAGIAMAFKLIDAAQERWRAVNAPHLVALVRAGPRFECAKVV
jgi:hypothetical protein